MVFLTFVTLCQSDTGLYKGLLKFIGECSDSLLNTGSHGFNNAPTLGILSGITFLWSARSIGEAQSL